jgi:hypothetical protein
VQHAGASVGAELPMLSPFNGLPGLCGLPLLHLCQQVNAVSERLLHNHCVARCIAVQYLLKPADALLLQADADASLSNNFGSICCALGNCKGMPMCPSKLEAVSNAAPGAVLQLVSRNLPLPQCK